MGELIWLNNEQARIHRRAAKDPGIIRKVPNLNAGNRVRTLGRSAGPRAVNRDMRVNGAPPAGVKENRIHET